MYNIHIDMMGVYAMPELSQTLLACRTLLREVTPLSGDCGAVCGGACCRSLEGEETGMLLFPGEAAYYDGLPGYTVRESAAGSLLICSGRCERDDRPLSCRLFPLLPVLREDGVKVAVDLRARVICPLAAQGRRAMRSEMVEAVRACGRLLAEDPEQRPFLEALTRMQDEMKTLMQTFGGR